MRVSLRSLRPAVLVFLIAGMARGQSVVDSVLHVADSLYVSGDYSRAELEARRLLESEILSDSVRVAAEQRVAFALVAQRQPALARGHFVEILRRRPQYELDPTVTSPKILAVFDEAKAAFRATEFPLSVPEIPPPGGITFRTILFPGWEQLYRRRTTAGTLFMCAGVATLGAGVALEFVRASARKDYLAATTPEEIESKYQTYRRTSRAETWAFASFAVVYLLSEVDVFMHDSPVALSLHPAGPGNPVNGLAFTLPLR